MTVLPDVVAILILLLCSFIFLCFKEFRISKKIFLLVFSVMVLRIVLIIINTYFYALPGSDMDAQRFINNARLIISDEIEYTNIVGAALYEHFLSLNLKIFDHVIIAINLSNIAFFTSILIVLKIFNLLNITKRIQLFCIAILLIYPSLLLHTVTTLREPYQFLFLTLAVYSYLLILHKGFKLSYMFFMYVNFLLFGLLHNGLLGFTPIIFIIVTIGLFYSTKEIGNKLFIIINGLMILIITVILFLSGMISSNMIDAIVDGEAAEYAENYREYIPDVRSSYNSSINTSNPLIGAITIVDATIKYFIYPLPWHISSPKDLVSVFENLFRIYILYFVIKNKKYINHLLPLLIVYFLLEILWAMGTANWGTAARHHVVQAQILVIVFAYVKNKISLDMKSRKLF